MLFFETVASFFRDREYRSLLVTANIVLVLGAVAYHYLEGWSWIDSLYFCVITLTTIGYGDLAPKTDAGKIFTMFYIVVGLGIILSFIQTVYHHYNQSRSKKQR
jgi:hypothetical protein